jgi:hypothetical protein
MREQKIAEELGRAPGQDFPDVLGSGLPYEVQLESPEAQPPSAPQGDPLLSVDPTKYEGRTPHNPLQRLLLPQTDGRPAPRLVRVNGVTSQALPAMPTASSDYRSSWGDRFGNGISFPQNIPPPSPN